MNKVTSTSSMISSFAHEGTKLSVTFRTGAVYHYKGVPEKVFHQMKAAPSHGQFFNTHIKGKYAV